MKCNSLKNWKFYHRHPKQISQLLIRKISSVCDQTNVNSNIKPQRITTDLNNLEGEDEVNEQQSLNNDDTSSKGHPYKSLFPWKSKRELALVLCTNIVYAKDGLIAISKPFGVGVTNINEQKARNTLFTKREINNLHNRGIGESPYTLKDILPLLKQELNVPDLQLMKSTGKYSSGIAVFTTNEKYSNAYKHSLEATKPYPLYNFSILSVNIPILQGGKMEERVGIKQEAHPLTDIKQPLIVREFSKNDMERQKVRPVHTSMRILSRGRPNVALLELKTSSMKWNFLQIYCADLMAPILGDHLFSSRVQTMMGVPTRVHPVHLAPGSTAQKLTLPLLQSLQLKDETDSLIIPTHIHLSSLTLKHYNRKKEPVVIQAPLSPYFQWTCDTLGLSVSSAATT